jgi:acid phosphatase
MKSVSLGCAMLCAVAFHASAAPRAKDPSGPKGPFSHIVIIYEENHSFDNLYGLWGPVAGEPVNGLRYALASKTRQVRQDNATPYQCLLQLDVNLTSPPLSPSCTDDGLPSIVSNFPNTVFKIDDFIASTDTTCPAPAQNEANGVLKGQGLPGGCTRDLAHRYYSEQYQIDGGKQDRYVTGSDAAGLTMGHYDTAKLPIYAFLHSANAPHYVIADNFYQGAFGGSFLNHQWLVAASTPVFTGALNDGNSQDLHSEVDANGMAASTPLYASPLGSAAKDGALTASCNPPAGRPATPSGVTCGDYAINTIQPFAQPYAPGTPAYKHLPPRIEPTIGDRLSNKEIRWAWYSGGWSNADGDIGRPGWTNGMTRAEGCTDRNAMPKAVWPNCPDELFQFHHQPFNYFAAYMPGNAARAEHLRDEEEFIERAQAGTLLPVSFVKPIGEENEHPGYASQSNGDSHLIGLLKTILNGPDGKNTLIIVTYDEFGGQWDHASPPGQLGAPGPHDKWGPGTRIPAILIASKFTHSGVNHVEHDTTSIMATLEHIYGLPPVGQRDAEVPDLMSAVNLGLHNGH